MAFQSLVMKPFIMRAVLRILKLPFPRIMHVYDARRKIISLLEGPDLTVVVEGRLFPFDRKAIITCNLTIVVGQA